MQIHFKATDAVHFRFDELRREITDYDGAEKVVVIPTHIDGMEVVSIGPEAFWNKGITSVILPPTLSVIGFYAFAFNRLQKIYIPDNVALIEDGAFMYNEIESLRIGKNIFAIPHAAFRNNRISDLVLPENTQEILSDAFMENPLTEIKFEGAPTFIHRFAFGLGISETARLRIRGWASGDLRHLLENHARAVDMHRVLSTKYEDNK